MKLILPLLSLIILTNNLAASWQQQFTEGYKSYIAPGFQSSYDYIKSLDSKYYVLGGTLLSLAIGAAYLKYRYKPTISREQTKEELALQEQEKQRKEAFQKEEKQLEEMKEIRDHLSALDEKYFSPKGDSNPLTIWNNPIFKGFIESDEKTKSFYLTRSYSADPYIQLEQAKAGNHYYYSVEYILPRNEGGTRANYNPYANKWLLKNIK